MFRTVTRISFFFAIILLLYRLMPTMPSSAALDATATPTVRPSATIPFTRTSVVEQTATTSPTSPARVTHTVQPNSTLRPTRTATPLATATVTPTATFTPTATPPNTPTPSGPYAWPDTSQDWAVFSPVAPIALHFTIPMNPASTGDEPALLAFPWLEGEGTWSDDAATLTFQPDVPLKFGQVYHLYLNPKLVTANGEALMGTTDWVLVAGRGPQVADRSPMSVQLPTRYLNAVLTFDRPMDTASVAAALSVQPALPLDLAWQENTLTISCTQVLTPGLQLAFTLAGNALDATGVPMVTDYTWNAAVKPFTVQVVPYLQDDNTPTSISVAFSYPMDRASVEASLGFSPAITGTLRWVGDTQLIMKPADDFSLWTTHQVVFTNTLQDHNGDSLPAPLANSYPPPFPIQPANEWDRAHYYLEGKNTKLPLPITFLVPVDRASVEAAFRIEPEVTGTFSWTDNSLVFQPEQPLYAGTTYQVTILPTAKAANGQALLSASYIMFFHIWVPGVVAPSFGELGANIQVVDSSGPRAIQFQGGGKESLEFALYRFDLPVFIEKYQKYFDIQYWSGRESPVIATDDAELAATWKWESGQMDARSVIPEFYLPADVEAGLYLLNMSSTENELYGQLFVVLTDNNLVVKWAGDELLTWVSDINGTSVLNIEVRLYSTNGEKLRTGQTDADGVYRTTIPAGYQPMLMVARTADNDFTISGMEGMWGDYSRYWWSGSNTQPITQPYRAYPYTDRPIYRPGQTVYFKAIVRAEQDVKYTLPPAGTAVIVHVRDTRDNIVQTYDLTTNEFGSVNGEFQLADGAMTGAYAVEVVIGETSFRQNFKVEDYRKPEIQVEIATDAVNYVAGDPLTITVQADYFFGEPVPNAKITVKQYRLSKEYCWWGENCTDEWKWFQDKSGVRYSSSTDANGQAVIVGIAEYENDKYYWYDYYDPETWYGNLSQHTWGLEVTVEDGSGQVVSNYTVIKVYNVAEKLKLDRGQYLKPTGKPFAVTASLATLDGEPVAGRELSVSLSHWNITTYQYEQVITPTLVTTGEDGQAVAMIMPPQNGYFRLSVQGKDSRGQELIYDRYIYAYSPGNTWATSYSRSELTIRTEQANVKPYDTVQLVIESTFAGPAMLTFERGRVNRVKPITLTPPLTVVDVEIIPEDAPNIFVTVNAWQPTEWYLLEDASEYAISNRWEHSLSDSILRRSSVELPVDASDKALNVAITSDQATYTPRQTATFTMTVTNAQGQPVEAELSLALVDEAIYALSEELVTPIFEHFYGRRERTVYTYNSMAPYRIIRIISEAGGGDGGGPMGLSPRADFPDTAIWLPTITTDKNGVVTVTVTLPDNLTTWRVVVRAATKSTLVGEATYNVTTQQSVVIRPQLPRSLTVGDEVILSAFVHNYTAGPLDLFASVQVSDAGLAISGTALIPVSLAAGEVKLVDWTANVLAAGEPQVTFAVFQTPVVDSGRVAWTVGDAVQLPLIIQPLAVPESVAETGSFDGEYNTLISLPPNALDQSTVRLELSRSVAGSLLEGLEYLTGYPYGCVEQTMSRALPNAVVGRAFEKLVAGETDRRENLEPLIRASVQRLYGYQHNDGGWGWWYDDATHDYQTAWVVFGLAVTADAGYEVDPQVIQRGVDWLSEHLAEMDVRTRAYALYSMAVAGHGDLAAVEALHAEALLELDPFSQAALALAYQKLGAAESAQAVLAVLAASATQKDGLVYWRQSTDDGHYTWKTMASTTRSTALALDALVQIDPQSSLIPGAVAWLMQQRRPNGWGNTNETAYAILALTDHLQSVQELLGPADLQIEINGRVILTASVVVQQPLLNVEIPFEQLQAGINHLSVKQIGGDGEVYYRLTQRIYLPETEIPAAGVISVGREYLDPKTKQPIANVSANDLVLVRLTVNIPQDGFYMIVEDHLPGGLEALNEKLNNTSHEMAYNKNYVYDDVFYWERYGYNNKEIRADRVSFFVTEMRRGKYEYTYLARATRPGDFSARPAEVYAMYNESLWGRSASGKITVLAE